MLQPIETRAFFERHWEREPLVVARAQRDYFAGLLSLDDVDRVLGTLDRRYPDVILKNADQPVSASEYTTDGATLDLARLYDLFDRGATISLAFLERVLPALGQLCQRLQLDLGCPMQANVYLTPGGAQGARVHYDTHDVFVLQIEGAKRWTLYESPIELPLTSQGFDPALHRAGAPTAEFDLRAGELAYLPRGCMHAARAMDGISLHVTLGLLRYTWTDLLLELVNRVALQEPALRRALPPDWAQPGADRSAMYGALREMLGGIQTESRFDTVIDRLHDRLIADCPPTLRGQLDQLQSLALINDSSVVGARPGLIARVSIAEGTVHIDCYGRRLSLPAHVQPAVNYALAHATFQVHELPGEMDLAGRLTLVRRLIREGLLRRLQPPYG